MFGVGSNTDDSCKIHGNIALKYLAVVPSVDLKGLIAIGGKLAEYCFGKFSEGASVEGEVVTPDHR